MTVAFKAQVSFHLHLYVDENEARKKSNENENITRALSVVTPVRTDLSTDERPTRNYNAAI